MNRGIQLWFYMAYITERIKLPTPAVHHTSFYTTKLDYISEFPYILTRVLYERRYASHMLHRHLYAVTDSRYGGSRYSGRR